MTTPAQKPLHDDALPSVLEQLPGFVLSTDAEMRVTSAYGRAFDDVRVPAGELVGFTLEELMKDDPARDVVLDTYRAVLAGTPGRFEYRARAVGRYYDTRVEPLRDDEGRVVGATGLAIDVTERKATEGLFRSLFESASVGITIGDIATRRPVRANAAFQRMAGRDEDELRGLSFEQLGHPDDVPLLEKRRRQLERGEVQAFRCEHRLLRADGAELWVDLAVSAVPAEGDRPTLAVAVSTDVSERRRGDEILAAVRGAAEQLLQATRLADEMPAVLAGIGAATRASRVYIFEKHEAADGEPVWSQRFEWVAAGIAPLLDDPALQEFRYREEFGRWADALERGDAVSGPVRSFPDRERRLLDAHGIRSMLVVPISVGGEWTGYVGLDDCEREREWSKAEVDALRAAARILGAAIQRLRSDEALRAGTERLRQGQKLEAVGRLAGGIAHDFNNLLTIILGCSEEALALLEPDSPARREVEDVRGAAEQAAALTRQLLAFGRRQELQPATVDLNEAVHGVVAMLRRLLVRDVELELEPGEGLPPVCVDPAQLSQVILNLAVNARDAMPDGGRLSISTAAADEDGYVALTVRDEGVGMTADVVARAFEPFFTTKEQGQGTGLGLATVHGIVTQSGGRIAVDSRPGTGTTVTVLLPRAA